MQQFFHDLWSAVCAPFLRLWRKPFVRRIVEGVRKLGVFLTEPVLGGYLDAYTSDNEPPFQRFRTRLARLAKNESVVNAIKIRISALLVLWAAILTAAHPGAPMALVCAGMGFSFFGDAMLMQYPPIRNMVRQYFLWGMGFFGAAQVCYLRAMWMLYARVRGVHPWPMYVAMSLYGLYALVLVGRLILFRPRQPLALRIGATVYAMLVAAMAGAAAAACFSTAGRGWGLLVGGLLFFISDMLIALTDFGGLKLAHKEAWIWGTYVPAQVLLITCTAALV